MGYRARPARTSEATALLELAAHLRKTLGSRGENLPAAWPDELVEDLRSGRLDGVVLEGPEGPDVGLGILSLRPRRAFAQVHMSGVTDPVNAVGVLMDSLLGRAPETVARVDFGVSGLSVEEEAVLGRRVAERPGFETIRRFGLARALPLSEGRVEPRLPERYRFHPIGEIPVPELARVDWEAFRDGPDAAFVADTSEENLHLLERIRAGQLGMFLEAASTGVADGEGHLAGFTLVVEESARVGVFVDIAVLPTARHRGVGEAMVRHGFKALLALGYERVRLWVTESNAPALRLYRRLGFQQETLSYIFRYRRGSGAGGPSPQTAR